MYFSVNLGPALPLLLALFLVSTSSWGKYLALQLICVPIHSPAIKGNKCSSGLWRLLLHLNDSFKCGKKEKTRTPSGCGIRFLLCQTAAEFRWTGICDTPAEDVWLNRDLSLFQNYPSSVSSAGVPPPDTLSRHLIGSIAAINKGVRSDPHIMQKPCLFEVQNVDLWCSPAHIWHYFFFSSFQSSAKSSPGLVTFLKLVKGSED